MSNAPQAPIMQYREFIAVYGETWHDGADSSFGGYLQFLESHLQPQTFFAEGALLHRIPNLLLAKVREAITLYRMEHPERQFLANEVTVGYVPADQSFDGLSHDLMVALSGDDMRLHLWMN